jgi:cell division protein FtsW
MTATAVDTRPTRRRTYDVWLLFAVLFLVGIGIVMVYSASSTLAQARFGSEYFFLRRQAIYALIGIVVLVICRHLPYRLFRFLGYPMIFIAAAALLAIPLTGMGVKVGGAARWLRIGGLSFQPSEFARFAMIVYLAYSLSKKADRVDEFTIGFLPHVLVLGVFTALLCIQPDFGAMVILGTLTWMMLFLGGVRLRYLSSAFVVVAPLALTFMRHADYRNSRIASFIDPWAHASKGGYQIIHSLMAFGTGGLWGTGLGKSVQKLFYLPEPHTDFIFSVIGEELGLVGVLVILFLYGLILVRGIRIARRAEDRFGMLLAAGLTAAIGLQAAINMGVSLGMLPAKGLTLPFLSYGGTSLVMCMASVGILMNIGATSEDRKVP